MGYLQRMADEPPERLRLRRRGRGGHDGGAVGEGRPQEQCVVVGAGDEELWRRVEDGGVARQCKLLCWIQASVPVLVYDEVKRITLFIRGRLLPRVIKRTSPENKIGVECKGCYPMSVIFEDVELPTL